MAKASDNASVFLNFLNLVAAVRSLPSFPSLDATDERMLYILGLAWARDKKIKETWVERTSAGNRASLRKYSPAYTNAVPETINQMLINQGHT